jgi:hypothetical protein
LAIIVSFVTLVQSLPWKESVAPATWSNWGVVIVGGIAGFLAWRTLGAIKTQAEIAANAQRSWIVETGIEDPDLSSVWVVQVRCFFKVIGMSPVKVSEAKFRFHFVDGKRNSTETGTEPDLPDTPDYGDIKTIADSPDMGSVRPPKEKFHVIQQLEGLFVKEGDIESLKNGERFLCLYGFIRYCDAFSDSQTRETRFCYIYGQRNPFDSRKNQFVVGGPEAYNRAT